MNEKVTADECVEADDPLKRICNLCGYRIGMHVVPAYGTWAETPTGLWCPSDARRGDKALPQLPSPITAGNANG